jgi:hypothetical protein
MRFVTLVLLTGLLSTTPAAADPVASAPGNWPDTRIEVSELSRSGDILTLKFFMINKSTRPVEFYSAHDFGDPVISTDFGTIGGIYLLDMVNKKKHLVLRDQTSQCVCSRGLQILPPDRTMILWGKFPAPPPSVQTITVVVPHFLPLESVPIGG